MGNDWKKIPLGSLVSLQRGHDLPSQNRYGGDVPVMGSSGLTGYHNESKCNGPGVVIGRSGNSMGVVSYIDDDYWPLNTCLYVTDFKGNDVRYIYYLLQQVDFDQFNSGSAQKSLNRNAVYPYELYATTNIEEQKKIGQFLSAFEEKVILNKKINQTLEQMVQTLFKSWFVAFDPVIDNALDANNPIPDELQQRATQRKAMRANEGFKPLPDNIRQLFPDSFEESELGWVPEDWAAGTLSSIASYSTERTAADDLELNNYISTENMLQNKQGICKAAKLPTVKTVPQYSTGNILISNIRPYFKKIWLARGQGGYSNDVLGFVVRNEGTEAYLFNLLYQDTFFDYMMTTSKGSKMPRGDKKAVMDWPIVIPSIDLQIFFSDKVKGFYESTHKRHSENETLTNLRDTLLPKLISGELRLDQLDIDTGHQESISEETAIS